MADSTVVGVFEDRQRAEKAIGELRNRGFEREISILARDERKTGDQRGEDQTGMMGNVRAGGQNLGEGTMTGGALGGLAGLAAGAGLVAIPGIGPILAAGPIAATLGGAVTGGLAGGLVDYGIPSGRGREYEEDVRSGRVLALVRADEDRAREAERILRDQGADRVEKH